MSEDVVLSVLSINGLTWEGRIKLLAGIVDEWNRANPKPQPIPLPTVPTDATCGGCRWWGLIKAHNQNDNVGYCYVEPDRVLRYIDNPACRHYEGKK